MQKVAWLLLLILISQCCFGAAGGQAHLKKLKSRYPYGLLGTDYGILTEEDLATNTCIAEPTVFSGEKNMAYPYWQCFAVKRAKMDCSSLGYDPVVKMETGYLEIYASNERGPQHYLARDAMNIKDCKSILRSWHRTTDGENYVCLSGPYGAFDDFRNGKKETGWVLDKFKTRKACYAVRGECHLGRHPDKNCQLPSDWPSHDRRG